MKRALSTIRTKRDQHCVAGEPKKRLMQYAFFAVVLVLKRTTVWLHWLVVHKLLEITASVAHEKCIRTLFRSLTSTTYVTNLRRIVCVCIKSRLGRMFLRKWTIQTRFPLVYLGKTAMDPNPVKNLTRETSHGKIRADEWNFL